MTEFEELDAILLDDGTAFQQKNINDRPETRLARAILIRSFLDILSVRNEEREEAQRWFAHYNTNHPYSFGSISELLGLAKEPITRWTKTICVDDQERRRLRMLIGRRSTGGSRHRIGEGVCAQLEQLLEAV